MIKVKKKKDKVKRKRAGNVRTTEKTKKKGGNVSQIVNVYVTKGGGGRRKAPAPSRPSFLQSQPQLFTANYDNTLLKQIQPIQDKYLKIINTNNDLLNNLLIQQRTADTSIRTDNLTNDKLYKKEEQRKIQIEAIERRTDNVIPTQTPPTFLTTQDTQTEPIFQPVDTQSDASSLVSVDQQITSDTELQDYLNYLTSVDKPEKLDEALQTQITILNNDLEDIEERVLELGGQKNTGTKPKKISALKNAIRQYEEQEKRLLLQQRRDDDPVTSEGELEELIQRDIQEQRQASAPAEQDELTTQLLDIRNRAKSNKIPLKRGGIPSTDEGKRNQIRYYSEQIALKNRATSI